MSRAVERAWAVLSSERTTAALVILLALAALMAAVVPQGKAAVELSQDPAATTIHQLAIWGLTDVMRSDWILAVAALLAGNLLAVGVSNFGRGHTAGLDAAPPKGAPHVAELDAHYPEQAVESLRELLISRLGAPLAEKTAGADTKMVFDAGRSAQLGPVLTHIGLIALIAGAALHARQQDEGPSIAKAVLEVTERRLNTAGMFDMVAGEWFSFFQLRSQYSVLDYTRNRDGAGPAVRIQRRADGGGRGEVFWVYADAPRGFDATHRNGEVSIEAVKIGMAPVPGAGLADSPVGVLLLFGIAAMGAGALTGRSARGRVWVASSGRRALLVGVPERRDDGLFARRFERWALEARAMLEP